MNHVVKKKKKKIRVKQPKRPYVNRLYRLQGVHTAVHTVHTAVIKDVQVRVECRVALGQRSV